MHKRNRHLVDNSSRCICFLTEKTGGTFYTVNYASEHGLMIIKLNDHGPTTIIAAITSVTKKLYLPSHILIGEQFGLTKPSMILLEQVACVNQKDLGNFVGAINNEKIKRAIRCGLKKTFGLWDYAPRGDADVRCLCPKCLQDYIHSNKYIVKRLDPFAAAKEQCDKCDSNGYDYILIPRKVELKDQMCKSQIRTFEMEAANE